MTGEEPHAKAIAYFAARRAGRPVAAPEEPETLAALEQVEALWSSLDSAQGTDRVARMRADALSRLVAEEEQGGRQFNWRSAALAASMAVLLCGVSIFAWQRTNQPTSSVSASAFRIVENGAAAPRTVALSDGTEIVLDARTRVRLAEDGSARKALVDAGRAYFRVRHDPARPFVVTVGDVSVTDIGTSFEIDRGSGRVIVTVVEGEVAVGNGDRSAAHHLTPGMRLTLAGGHGNLSRLDAAKVTDWQSGVMTVDDEALGTVLDRFNHYMPRPIVLRDKAAADLRISGLFRFNDPEGLVRAISALGYPNAVKVEGASPASD